MKVTNYKAKNKTIFIKSFIGGLAWMLGATVGFALLITLMGIIVRWFGGLPIIGDFIANLIKATTKALEVKRGLP